LQTDQQPAIVIIMKRHLLRALAVVAAALGFVSCADENTRPAGPTSDTSAMPWNTPVRGQGQGQFGMMPQNQYRR